jgi:transposase
MRALDLKKQGWKQRDIATALGVTVGAVSQWLAAVRDGGTDSLLSRTSRRGRPPKLATESVRLIPEFLWHGPEAYGFPGDRWTCDRVVNMIAEEFAVRYSTSQVYRLLQRLRWSPKVPIARAIRRDEPVIERWRAESWPALRERARHEHRTTVFVDESDFNLLPGMVKTYAREGEPSFKDEWQTRDHVSMMGGVTPQGKMYSLMRPTSLNEFHTIEFLLHLVHSVGDRLLVIWDGSPIHRRAEVQEFLAEVGGKILVEPLPPFAPDLNPAGWLCQHLRDVEMRNLTCSDLEQLHMELYLALGRVRQKPNLIQSFFVAAGLAM